ncbi:hypothetical protein J2W88_002778 [Acidovorax delafieldii]|uniref:Uncharacterized protein n=1 Tax=Acidovorax delafieldii TaxID=47920 RepID=A0AAJ2BS47_ACIDE|nr:hypothetical protein [Acidovorax delafieldii]MDR6767497.1 hypothetical protein [Acidovorax delafieldii]MDR6838719.1 hypothetical protein [Acidovorax delafieldii]MDR7368620.1 hypothetical protein [Acidovorax delafieldii]
MATTPENEEPGPEPQGPAETELVVRSEEEAFELLRQALTSELEDHPYVLQFENWPILTLRFVGDGYDSTITPHIAEALVELQHAMNRSYARLVKHAANANVLTKEERQSIEFKAKVDEGSSLITVDLGDYAQTLTTALVGKMTGTELVITVLGLAITGGALVAYRSFLATRSEDKKVDQATQQTVQLSEQETRRMQIFADALTQRPALQAVHEDFDNVRHDILKSVGDAERLDVQGISLQQDQARKIASTPRSKPEEVQLNGTYRIVKLDWSKEDEVRISVFGLGATKQEFIASMRAHNLTPQNIEKLKACEWERRPAYLSINATVLRGEVTTATIVGVEWPDDAAPPAQPA